MRPAAMPSHTVLRASATLRENRLFGSSFALNGSENFRFPDPGLEMARKSEIGLACFAPSPQSSQRAAEKQPEKMI
jgi:hypothetical protein